INADAVVDAADLLAFVNVLLGNDTDAGHIQRSDMDCSGAADGDDIQAFVQATVTFEPPPPPHCTGIPQPYVNITYDHLQSFVPYTGPQPTVTFYTWGLTALDVPGPGTIVAHALGQIWASTNSGCSWQSIAQTNDGGGLYRIIDGPSGYAYAWVDNG